MTHRGHRIKRSAVADGPRTYTNGVAVTSEERPCTKCGKTARGYEAVDPCLGILPGVKAACCGHGKERGYIMFDNGVIIRGKFAVVKGGKSGKCYNDDVL